MTQSMINPNIKNLVIYNKAKRIVAKTTAFYNNDYIICNNIEVADFFMNNPQTTEIDRVELLNAVLSGILAQVNMLPDNLQKVVIGMDRNDLVKELEKYALQIIRDNLILNYKYHNYQGDANNRAKGQAIVYIR